MQTRSSITRTIVGFNLCLVLTCGVAHAGFITPGLESQLNTMQGDSAIKVLVVMSQQADIRALDWELHDSRATMDVRHYTVIETLRDQAKSSQTALLADLESNKASGAILGYTSHWIVNAVVVVGTVDAVRELAARADVERVEADLVVELIEPVSTEQARTKDHRGIGTSPGVAAINARRVWEELGIDGTGVIVGILDTGVAGDHPALQDRWRGNFAPADECWLDAIELGYPTPEDLSGHGTHVMGIITGLAVDDTIGVAPGALWIASNALYQNVGPDLDNDIIASFEFMTDPDGDPTSLDDVPAVVHNSWGVHEGMDGYFDCDSRWWDAIDNCEAAGVVVTFSAGNEGPEAGSVRSPADRAASPTNCFSVGSTQNFSPFEISDFSSRGPSGCGGDYAMKPEIVAPGSDIYSAHPDGGYVYLSGTSMAGPHVAGVVALMRASNPNIDVITVKEVLMNSARDLGVPGEDNTYGHGFVNAFAAVQAVMIGNGTVEGIVTDSVTGLPIEGVLVKKVDDSNMTITDAHGFYSMTMPNGFVDLELTLYGYFDGALSVEIIEGSIVNGDLALVHRPYNILSGFVYGPTGEVVPDATVEAMDTVFPAVLTDNNGFYSLNLISGAGALYTVQARFSGLGHQDQDIELVGDMTLDFNLPELFPEGFESGDFSTYLWDQGDIPWVISTNTPPEGVYCARSGNVDQQYQNSQLSITMEIADTDLMTFWYKVSCEPTFDYLHFYMDGELRGSWSGDVEWTQFSMSVGAGVHTFLWIYAHESFSPEGENAAYIDFIEFPGQGTPGIPVIHLSTDSFSSTLPVNGTEDQTLTISNIGTAQLTYLTGLVEVGSVAKTPSPIPYTTLERGEEDTRGSITPVKNSGGPDAFGYTWIDSDEAGGPEYNWIDISDTGLPGPDGLGQSLEYSIGFDFSYYGVTYNTVYVCSNGFMSFTSDVADWQHQGIPNAAEPNNLLAVFWDSLQMFDGGEIFVQRIGNQFIVQYEAVEHYNAPQDKETFQVILDIDGSITYQYAIVSEGRGCSVGIENGAGDDGLQVVFNGNYLHDDLAIRFASESPLTWVTVSPESGAIDAGGSDIVTVHFDASDLALGTYEAILTVISNDPVSGVIDLPVTLVVADDVTGADDGLPSVVRLTGAVPNPFNPITEIKFSLPHDSHVKLDIYDVAGRLITRVLNDDMTAGAHSVLWAGRDSAGKSVASGTYFMRLVADGETEVKSMVLIR